MFKKNKMKRSNSADEKLVKKLLGKNAGRRVFGYKIRPEVHARLKMLAGKLHVDLSPLAEHVLELSAGFIAKAEENPEESALLREHLNEYHVNVGTIEAISAYDRDLADWLDEIRMRRFEFDKAAHKIVVTYLRRGVKPKLVSWYTDYGLRCKFAIAQGKPIPQDWPPDN